MNSFLIFIVEDDIGFGVLLEHFLSLNPEYKVERYTTGKACLENLYKKPSVISLDYNLPDMTGSEILKIIHQRQPSLPVIILSGQDDIETAIQLLKEGAHDYIIKAPDAKDRLWNALRIIKENYVLRTELNELREHVEKKYDFSATIKGSSPQIQRLFSFIERAASTNITVYITGETGTGKELVAKSIHYNSERKNKPFVPINVTAIPKELIESEFFGFEKGAFTGAIHKKIGLLEQSDGGTLFLDEISEMEISMQSKLLRAIQEREFTRIGNTSPTSFDCRIIIATNKDLREEVASGRFREDLYYRLLGLPIQLPPLRERGSDIIYLTRHFVDEFCKENKIDRKDISPEANDKLMSYSYPGNVRELKAIAELACVMTGDNLIGSEHILFNPATSPGSFLEHEKKLHEYTLEIINHFLKKYDNNIRTVAKKLGIGKSTIYRILKQYKEMSQSQDQRIQH